MADEEEIANLAVKLGLKADKHEFAEGSELLDKLKEGLEFFAGFEAVKGLFELVEHTTEAAVASKHLAEQLGVSIEAVQELGYAADVTGGSTENMRVSLQHLAFAMQTASKTGTGPLVDGLAKLHIPLANLKKEKLDQNLEEIAEGFKNAGPEVNKTALAIELFGRKGTSLIPLLNKGKEGIKELREEFVSLGDETSAEQAEQLEKFEEVQKKVKYLWEGIKFDAVMAILPTLEELVKTLFAWVKANRELISTSIVNLMHALAFAFELVGTAAGAFFKILNFLSQDGDAIKAILIGIGAAITYVAGAALLAWAEGQILMLGWTGLLVGIIYAVMKLIDLFEYLWDEAADGSGWAMAAIVALTAAVTVLGIGLVGALGPTLIDMLVTGLAYMTAYVGVIWSSVAATWAWTAALLANPITWIVLAVVAAVALLSLGIYELIKHWDAVIEKIKKFGFIGAAAFGPIGIAIYEIATHWDQVIEYLKKKWNAFKGWIKDGAIDIGVGLLRQIPIVGSAAANAIDSYRGQPSLSSSDSKAGGGDTTNNVTAQIDVHAAPGMDEDKLAEATKDQFNEMWEEKVRTNYSGAGIG